MGGGGRMKYDREVSLVSMSTWCEEDRVSMSTTCRGRRGALVIWVDLENGEVDWYCA
jgi:hypothetical protein